MRNASVNQFFHTFIDGNQRNRETELLRINGYVRCYEDDIQALILCYEVSTMQPDRLIYCLTPDRWHRAWRALWICISRRLLVLTCSAPRICDMSRCKQYFIQNNSNMLRIYVAYICYENVLQTSLNMAFKALRYDSLLLCVLKSCVKGN